jgi:hypothetical protein
MRRFLLVLFAAVVLGTLLVPGMASAASYTVKNRSGGVAGTVTIQDAYWAQVMKPSGSVVGNVGNEDGTWYVGEPSGNIVAIISKAGASTWMVGSSNVPDGRARLINGKWVLAKKVNGEWKKRGSMTGKKAAGKWAAGALRLLLWK